MVNQWEEFGGKKSLRVKFAMRKQGKCNMLGKGMDTLHILGHKVGKN